MARSVWLLAALLLPAGVRDACAQAVRGQLVDAETSRPVSQALLTLRASDSTVQSRATSDAEGRWRLSATRPGLYHI